MIDPAGQGWDCHLHVFDAQAPVLAGHYRPAHWPLQRIEATAQAHGVRRLVLVQPSVYGHDNSLVLAALAREPGRHRGVVVLRGDEPQATLEAWHAHGVRGARLNRVSPVGEAGDAGLSFDALAPRLEATGWHLQWYVRDTQLPAVAALHAGSRIPAVLDHLGGLNPSSGPAAWAAAEALAAQGAWVKLSGWYRQGVDAPYTALQPVVARLQTLFGSRLVWGSDWPHTAFAPEAIPAYADTWRPASGVAGLHAAAARLYG